MLGFEDTHRDQLLDVGHSGAEILSVKCVESVEEEKYRLVFSEVSLDLNQDEIVLGLVQKIIHNFRVVVTVFEERVVLFETGLQEEIIRWTRIFEHLEHFRFSGAGTRTKNVDIVPEFVMNV
jgi:hypothetical protein